MPSAQCSPAPQVDVRRASAGAQPATVARSGRTLAHARLRPAEVPLRVAHVIATLERALPDDRADRAAVRRAGALDQRRAGGELGAGDV